MLLPFGPGNVQAILIHITHYYRHMSFVKNYFVTEKLDPGQWITSSAQDLI